MQLISIYLYPNKVDLYTNSLADWTAERYRKVYNRTLKIYRGVDNKIDLQARNQDQKASSLGSAALVFTLVEPEQKKKILETDCVISSAVNGRSYVLLSDSQLNDIQPGYYQYTLRTEQRTYDDDGNYTVTSSRSAYTDSQFDTFGSIEIVGSIQGEPQPSVEIKEFSRQVDYQANSTRYTSGIINANPTTSNPQRLHTFQIYPSDCTGTMTIQASQDEGGAPKNWIDVESQILNSANQSFYLNVLGKFNWFRVHLDAAAEEIDGTFIINQTIFLNYEVTVLNPGSGYTVGQTITVPGRNLGGETVTNDLTITVTSIDENGGILTISWTGISYNGTRSFTISPTDLGIRGVIDKILYR
jgi:hypothetical protein